ncbi:chemotaxis protein CheW [Neptuniibacter caesariensis]|uniref:Twitching motility protein n=1 Tax=Neptuniibacter caesariensis TaxID=207954 RepID=A0A7U8C6Q4_NEPCE|nr:chemotaxis protein CheW [Neptuniibacter caesariensis]EAR62528.1 twitching motility protein [Oceanospirillum sp. MED92] [Neptuniibacter caesariensis]
MEPIIDSTSESQEPQIHKIRHGFMISSYALLIMEGVRAEVVKAPSICSIPSTPEWFAGFINHRGETAPVYDLDNYLQMVDEPKQDQEWVLLIDNHPHTVGVLLRQPPRSITDPVCLNETLSGLPEVIEQAAGDAYEFANQQWLEIDHHRLFLALKNQF